MKKIFTVMVELMALVALAAGPVAAADKPNVVFIMGDDIGWFNIGAYHQGIMAGRTPNLDKMATERGRSPTSTGSCMSSGVSSMYSRSIEFPPMQKGASFNLEALEQELQKKMEMM